MFRHWPPLLKRNPVLVLCRLALAVGRVLAQLAEGLTPIHAARGDRARVVSCLTACADGANMAGTCKTCGLVRLAPAWFLSHQGKSVRGQARQSVPSPGTSG